jgi:hypothetical protein
MLRRSLRRGLRREIRQNTPPELLKANELMATGQYAPAAKIFGQLGEAAVSRNGPRAPWFFLQGGQAWISANELQKGMADLKKGFDLFANRGQILRLFRVGRRTATELMSRGYEKEAGEVETYIKSILPAGFIPDGGSVNHVSRALLPTNCPGCGGPIHPDEIEWMDQATAECPYCGSAVRGNTG